MDILVAYQVRKITKFGFKLEMWPPHLARNLSWWYDGLQLVDSQKPPVRLFDVTLPGCVVIHPFLSLILSKELVCKFQPILRVIFTQVKSIMEGGYFYSAQQLVVTMTTGLVKRNKASLCYCKHKREPLKSKRKAIIIGRAGQRSIFNITWLLLASKVSSRKLLPYPWFRNNEKKWGCTEEHTIPRHPHETVGNRWTLESLSNLEKNFRGPKRETSELQKERQPFLRLFSVSTTLWVSLHPLPFTYQGTELVRKPPPPPPAAEQNQ